MGSEPAHYKSPIAKNGMSIACKTTEILAGRINFMADTRLAYDTIHEPGLSSYEFISHANSVQMVWR